MTMATTTPAMMLWRSTAWVTGSKGQTSRNHTMNENMVRVTFLKPSPPYIPRIFDA
jgi:hypothetical protein